MIVSLLGILGGLCFAWCGVPAAYLTFKARRSVGTSIFSSWMIVLGSIFMYLYLNARYGFNLLLTVNYFMQLISWGIIIFYHYFPKDEVA